MWCLVMQGVKGKEGCSNVQKYYMCRNIRCAKILNMQNTKCAKMLNVQRYSMCKNASEFSSTQVPSFSLLILMKLRDIYDQVSIHVLGINVASTIITRVSLICSCPMFLALFPFDEQTCPLSIASCKLFLSLSLSLSLIAREVLLLLTVTSLDVTQSQMGGRRTT